MATYNCNIYNNNLKACTHTQNRCQVVNQVCERVTPAEIARKTGGHLASSRGEQCFPIYPDVPFDAPPEDRQFICYDDDDDDDASFNSDYVVADAVAAVLAQYCPTHTSVYGHRFDLEKDVVMIFVTDDGQHQCMSAAEVKHAVSNRDNYAIEYVPNPHSRAIDSEGHGSMPDPNHPNRQYLRLNYLWIDVLVTAWLPLNRFIDSRVRTENQFLLLDAGDVVVFHLSARPRVRIGGVDLNAMTTIGALHGQAPGETVYLLQTPPIFTRADGSVEESFYEVSPSKIEGTIIPFWVLKPATGDVNVGDLELFTAAYTDMPVHMNARMLVYNEHVGESYETWESSLTSREKDVLRFFRNFEIEEAMTVNAMFEKHVEAVLRNSILQLRDGFDSGSVFSEFRRRVNQLAL
jgi:hypothetical protein